MQGRTRWGQSSERPCSQPGLHSLGLAGFGAVIVSMMTMFFGSGHHRPLVVSRSGGGVDANDFPEVALRWSEGREVMGVGKVFLIMTN